MPEMTHEITIRFNAANPDVLALLQRIASLVRHPQYQGDVTISQPHSM